MRESSSGLRVVRKRENEGQSILRMVIERLVLCSC
jgi:hypothetical protein